MENSHVSQALSRFVLSCFTSFDGYLKILKDGSAGEGKHWPGPEPGPSGPRAWLVRVPPLSRVNTGSVISHLARTLKPRTI